MLGELKAGEEILDILERKWLFLLIFIKIIGGITHYIIVLLLITMQEIFTNHYSKVCLPK